MEQALDRLSSAFSASGDWPEPRPVTPGRKVLTIGEMAREFGTTIRTLRFYEAKRLLTPERQGAARLYGPLERQRLPLILKAKRLGFTLNEIRQMLGSAAEPGGAGELTMSRAQCFEQIKFLEQRKREIEAALADLRRTYSSFYVRLAGA
jgi:DNA-binding transcriptional MerR regulator